MTPTPTDRWWAFVESKRIFCGPEGIGHHMASTFSIPEHGFIQCTEKAAPPALLELCRLRQNANPAIVQRYESEMRRIGMDVPSAEVLRRMIKDAPLCGRWVFLLVVRGGRTMVFEVSKDDRMAMEGLSTPAEMLEYLGVFKKR